MNAISNFRLWRCFLALVCCCLAFGGAGCASYFPTSESQYQNLQTKKIKEGTNTSQTMPHPGDTSYEGREIGNKDAPYGELGAGSLGKTNRPVQIVPGGVTAIAGGTEHSLFLKSDGSLWATGFNGYGQLGDGTYNNTNLPEQIVAGPPGYNQIAVQLLSGGNVDLSFVGIAGTNYALDRSFSLSPANWVPLATNPAGAGGVLVFTNMPDSTTNNFWRIRSAP